MLNMRAGIRPAAAAASTANPQAVLPIPDYAEPVAVAEGIFWLRLPLPFALNHVNLWLCDDGDAWSIVDSGYGDGPTRATWERLLGGLLAGRPVTRLLVTHFHPDHFGQTGWLGARTGAELWMSRTEWLTARMLAFDTSETSLAEIERNYRRAALPEAVVARQRERGHAYRRGVSEPPGRYRRLCADDRVSLAGSTWRVLIGEGHAPEQVTLYCEERRLLIAADQILERISPVIGVWSSQPEADPLSDYLRSLEQYRDLPPDCRVLPSHGAPFEGLHARLEELVSHHEERLDAALAACGVPVSAEQVLRSLFPRELDPHQTGFALGETLSHLNYLVEQGVVERWADESGVLLYRTR
jgi:glyoxylase-like metal-dependent hydrolase (beta-lactamase superfamily II)